MEAQNLFGTIHRLRAYRGDTLPTFKITINGGEAFEPTSMQMRFHLENARKPGKLEFSKTCTKTVEDDGTMVFKVQLNSDETGEFLGLYNMHFVLQDSDSEYTYRKLVGTLEFLEIPKVPQS